MKEIVASWVSKPMHFSALLSVSKTRSWQLLFKGIRATCSWKGFKPFLTESHFWFGDSDLTSTFGGELTTAL